MHIESPMDMVHTTHVSLMMIWLLAHLKPYIQTWMLKTTVYVLFQSWGVLILEHLAQHLW